MGVNDRQLKNNHEGCHFCWLPSRNLCWPCCAQPPPSSPRPSSCSSCLLILSCPSSCSPCRPCLPCPSSCGPCRPKLSCPSSHSPPCPCLSRPCSCSPPLPHLSRPCPTPCPRLQGGPKALQLSVWCP